MAPSGEVRVRLSGLPMSHSDHRIPVILGSITARILSHGVPRTIKALPTVNHALSCCSCFMVSLRASKNKFLTNKVISVNMIMYMYTWLQLAKIK